MDSLNLAKKMDLLQKQKVFLKLSELELTELAGLLTEKNFTADQIIVNEGDPVDSIYLIVNGTAEVKQISREGSENKIVSLAVLGPGQAIGLSEVGFYSLTGRRTATVVAQTEITTLYLSMPRFNGFALANAHVGAMLRQWAAQSSPELK